MWFYPVSFIRMVYHWTVYHYHQSLLANIHLTGSLLILPIWSRCTTFSRPGLQMMISYTILSQPWRLNLVSRWWKTRCKRVIFPGSGKIMGLKQLRCDRWYGAHPYVHLSQVPRNTVGAAYCEKQLLMVSFGQYIFIIQYQLYKNINALILKKMCMKCNSTEFNVHAIFCSLFKRMTPMREIKIPNDERKFDTNPRGMCVSKWKRNFRF